MDQGLRHQCLIYDGLPPRQMAPLAATICRKLNENYRCLYLNSEPMVAEMSSHLAADGIDVPGEIERGSLVLSSERQYLAQDGSFDLDRMMQALEQGLDQALRDGYKGLWASGDMSWEFGPKKDFVQFLEYEWRLEEFLRKRPQMGGVCQYHAESLPREVLRQGLSAHRSLFINETLSVVNPQYLPPESFCDEATRNAEFERALLRLLDQKK